MNEPDVDVFLSELEASLKKYFTEYKIEFFVRTSKSLKANIYLSHNLFIAVRYAVRYNVRNERIDFALIRNDQRIFGYDNLKEWHYHPYGSPSDHFPCNKPPIDKIISDIREVCEKYYV